MHLPFMSWLWMTLKAGSNVTLTRKAGQVVITSTATGSLEMKEQDGSPDVSGVSVIKVTNGTLTDEGGGTVSLSISGTGAPTDAQYVTLATNGTLTDERVLTAGSGITLTDAGAGSTVTVASKIGSDGWQASADTWTYSSADGATGVFTISSDYTDRIGLGMRLKLTQTTVKYFIVTKISVSSGTTTVTCWGGTDYTLANAAITAPYWSMEKCPFGFPMDPTKWQITFTSSSGVFQSNPTQNTWYNLGSYSIDIHIGFWDVFYEVAGEITASSASGNTIMRQQTTLSTANNTESDTGFTSEIQVFAANGTNGLRINSPMRRQKYLGLTSKTTYYLNASSKQAGTIADINFRGDHMPQIIIARCAYL